MQQFCPKVILNHFFLSKGIDYDSFSRQNNENSSKLKYYPKLKGCCLGDTAKNWIWQIFMLIVYIQIPLSDCRSISKEKSAPIWGHISQSGEVGSLWRIVWNVFPESLFWGSRVPVSYLRKTALDLFISAHEFRMRNEWWSFKVDWVYQYTKSSRLK